MRYSIVIMLVIFGTMGFVRMQESASQNPEPWSTSQLMMPADLASMMNNPKVKQPMVISIGPGALIKGSLDMGAVHVPAGLEKFRLQINKLPKDTRLIIYCGCCPFEHCPNIRPAFRLLNEMKFTQARLLNLEHNIKTDWVSKGYPSVSQ